MSVQTSFTYRDIILKVATWIAGNALNIANYSSIPAYYLPGYTTPKITISGSGAYVSSYQITNTISDITNLNDWSANNVNTNLINWLKVNNHYTDSMLNEVIDDKGFIRFYNYLR